MEILFFYLPDCNVSKKFEERLNSAICAPDIAGSFTINRFNLYDSKYREKAKSVGVNDAPTAVIVNDNGLTKLHGVQSEYSIRLWLRASIKQHEEKPQERTGGLLKNFKHKYDDFIKRNLKRDSEAENQ